MFITTTIPTSRKLQQTKQRDPKPYIHIGRLPMPHHSNEKSTTAYSIPTF